MNRYKVKEFKKHIDGYASMLGAIKKAGGALRGFTTSQLSQMSALELIAIFSINDIRFYWTKSHKLVRKEKKNE